VPPLEEDGEVPTTVRARLEQHRRNSVCASCHSRMDPLGFALENFDAIGQWRTIDGVAPVDASGVLLDGTRFNGPAEFRKAMLSHDQEFVGTVLEKLMTYALGRGVEYSDMPAIRKIRREAAPDYRWSSLILGIVKSTPFQMRAAQESGSRANTSSRTANNLSPQGRAAARGVGAPQAERPERVPGPMRGSRAWDPVLGPRE